MGNVLVEYDPEVEATYVTVLDADPAQHVEVQGETVAVDLDADGVPVGVELLVPPTRVTPEMLSAVSSRFPGLGERVAEALIGTGYHAA
ncbi:MAG: DUF2283 domain-containing protein [Nitrososphaerales archaeon]